MSVWTINNIIIPYWTIHIKNTLNEFIMKRLTILLAGMFIFGSLMAEKVIRISQIGYLPDAKKVAVVMTGDSGNWHYERYDFSDMKEEGWHQLHIDGAVSDSFLISSHIFDNMADFPLNYMRQQRCGWNPFTGDSCHVHDGYIIYHPDESKNGTHIDVRGGWHDASDCLQYSTTTANAIYQMMLAYELHPEQFGDNYQTDGTPGSNGIPDIIDEIRWGLDWLDRMNPAPGEFYNQLADDRDHKGMHLPKDDIADYGWGVNNGRPVYFVTGEPQIRGKFMNISTGTSSIVGKFASDFALGSKILKPYYPELAERIGKKAKDAYDLGVRKPGFSQTASVVSPYVYEETNWVDDMELGAYELYRQTGKSAYLQSAAAYGRQEPTTPWMGVDTARHYEWYPFMNIGHYRLATCKDKKVREEFTEYLRLGIDSVYKRAIHGEEVHRGFMYGIPSIWCSNNLTTAMLTQCILYRQLTGDETYLEMESALRDWLFGCNPWGVCMIIELPGATRYPTQPHSFIINEHLGNTTGGMVDGPVYQGIFNNLQGVNMEGGINYMKYQPTVMVYHDATHDYSTNEPTMDGTACLTFPFAAYAAEAQEAAKKK